MSSETLKGALVVKFEVSKDAAGGAYLAEVQRAVSVMNAIPLDGLVTREATFYDVEIEVRLAAGYAGEIEAGGVYDVAGLETFHVSAVRVTAVNEREVRWETAVGIYRGEMITSVAQFRRWVTGKTALVDR